jgi:hypothetical protein
MKAAVAYFKFFFRYFPRKIILIYHRGLYNRPKWPQYQGLIDTYGLEQIPRDSVPPHQ